MPGSAPPPLVRGSAYLPFIDFMEGIGVPAGREPGRALVPALVLSTDTPRDRAIMQGAFDGAQVTRSDFAGFVFPEHDLGRPTFRNASRRKRESRETPVVK